MDPIWNAIAKVIETIFVRPENIALLISVAMNVALSWFIIKSRGEDRLDRKAMTDALVSMKDAITKVTIVLAAATGKGDL
jgi:hypothetical protein